MTTELQLVNPRNDAELVAKMRQHIMDIQATCVAEIDAATADIEANGLGEHVKSAFDDAKDALADGGKAFVGGILKEVGADAVLVQLTATQTAVREAVKRYEAAWTKAKEASAPPEPTHTYAFQIEATDKALAALLKHLAKSGVKYRYSAPQSDKAFKALDRWFEENMGGAA